MLALGNNVIIHSVSMVLGLGTLVDTADPRHHLPKHPEPSKLSRFDVDRLIIVHKDCSQPLLPNDVFCTWKTLRLHELPPP